MTAIPWLQPLTKAVSKLSPKSDLAQFRNEFSEIVRPIKEDNNKSRELLLEVRPLVEGWVTQEDKCPCCALREWSNFYEKSVGALPVDALVLFAKKLPQVKPGAVDWQPFFFSCRHKPVLTAIFDRRIIGKATLQSWIAEKLQSAYPLPVLDVAIENDAIPDWRALWNCCVKAGERPVGLRRRIELLAISYFHAPTGTLDKELSTYLVENASARVPFFKSALGLPEFSPRLTELLASSFSSDSGDGLINDFVTVCADLGRVPNPEMQRATWALASLRLVLGANMAGRSASGNRIKTVDAASMQLAVTALARIEENPSSQFGACLSALSADQLHDIVHSHLKSLASTTSDASGPSDRSSKYERHLGKKEVLDKVVDALAESPDGESLRGSIEVALFNLGVRPLGNVGDRIKFESRLHNGQDSGIVPGDIVEIVTAGRCLGKGEELLVLTKAKVRRTTN